MVHPALPMRSAAAGVALLALLACCGAVSSGESVPLLIALKQRNLDVLEARFWEVRVRLCDETARVCAHPRACVDCHDTTHLPPVARSPTRALPCTGTT